MFSVLTNIYVLPLIVTILGLCVFYGYSKMTKTDDECPKSCYFKTSVCLYLVSLGTLWLFTKLTNSNTSSTLVGGATNAVSAETVTAPIGNFNVEKFNTGRPTF